MDDSVISCVRAGDGQRRRTRGGRSLYTIHIMTTERPNVVLIMADQQRMDSLRCYGNRFVDSPHLDALAARGTRFDCAFTPWPVCTPARGTMWTGLYPHAHGLIDNVYDIANAFATVAHPRARTTVFERLRGGGYHTAHFGKWHLGEEQPPFFDTWQECFNSRRSHWVDGRQNGTYRPDLQTDAAVAFLRQASEPFVLVQGFYPPHDPYTAPQRFYAPYRGKGVPFAGYYAAVSALDHCTGRLYTALTETGLAERTLVVYFSDHGDTFFYRREGEHKFVCYDDAIRTPLIIAGPGVTVGAARSEPVGLQDLTPTLLDYAGIAAPDQMHGRSLRPLLEGHPTPPGWRQSFYVENTTHVSAIRQRCVRAARYKLIASDNGEHELYDLEQDPEEELNIFLTPRPDPGFERYRHIPDQSAVIAELAQALQAHAEHVDDELGRKLAAEVSQALAERRADYPDI